MLKISIEVTTQAFGLLSKTFREAKNVPSTCNTSLKFLLLYKCIRILWSVTSQCILIHASSQDSQGQCRDLNCLFLKRELCANHLSTSVFTWNIQIKQLFIPKTNELQKRETIASKTNKLAPLSFRRSFFREFFSIFEILFFGNSHWLPPSIYKVFKFPSAVKFYRLSIRSLNIAIKKHKFSHNIKGFIDKQEHGHNVFVP